MDNVLYYFITLLIVAVNCISGAKGQLVYNHEPDAVIERCDILEKLKSMHRPLCTEQLNSINSKEITIHYSQSTLCERRPWITDTKINIVGKRALLEGEDDIATVGKEVQRYT